MSKSVFWTVVKGLVRRRVQNSVFVVFWTAVRGFVSIRVKSTVFFAVVWTVVRPRSAVKLCCCSVLDSCTESSQHKDPL